MGVEIQVNDLTKSFGKQLIWGDVTLTIPAGEICVMLGPSGTGKSVFLKTLIGLLKPDQGSITIEGTDIASCSERDLYEIRKLFGVLFQDGAMCGSMNLYGWLQEDVGSGETARAAQTAAERAVVPVLSYDFENLEADREAATAEMTGRYRTEYDKLFVVIEENAPQTETKVGAEVVASGIVRAADDRVQVLVFVDRPTTNKLSAEPTVYKDQVTLSMQLVDDVWLVDDMVPPRSRADPPGCSVHL